MAFTTTCKRLGHGKGYYDTYLAKHAQWCQDHDISKQLMLVGVGLREQLVADIPYESHDRLLDAVVVDSGIHKRAE